MEVYGIYICDFTKNKDCDHKCVYFGGTCAATRKAECAMSEEDIKNLSAEDFEKMHYSLPKHLRARMVELDWYWVKHMDSLKKAGWGDANEKEQSS